jgi:hypothetical protein
MPDAIDKEKTQGNRPHEVTALLGAFADAPSRKDSASARAHHFILFPHAAFCNRPTGSVLSALLFGIALRRCSSASLFGVALRRRQLVCPITSDFSSHPFQATPTLTLTHVALPVCVESTSKSE